MTIAVDTWTRAVLITVNNLCGGRGWQLGVADVQQIIDGECAAYPGPANDPFFEGLATTEEAQANLTPPGDDDEVFSQAALDETQPLPDLNLHPRVVTDLLGLLAQVTEAQRPAGRLAYAEAIRDHRETVAVEVEKEVAKVDADRDSDPEDRASTAEWAREKLAGYDHMFTTICTRLDITLEDQ